MRLLSIRQSRELDSEAVSLGVPALTLMENAGRALADVVEKVVSPQERARVLVLAGRGQNGGDGFVAARHLISRGHAVRIVLFGDPESLRSESSVNYMAIRPFLPGERLTAIPTAQSEEAIENLLGKALRDVEKWAPDVLVDALLGTGQKGDPSYPLNEAIDWANSLGVPIVSCDLPSGIDADTGWAHEPSIRATVTVTMGAPKIGLYSYPGRSYCGDIVVERLGIPEVAVKATDSEPLVSAVFAEDVARVMPARRADHHKGMSGHVCVLAGSVGMTGAAALSARACLRAGAGTVTLLCPGAVYQVCASASSEVMVVPFGRGPVFDLEGSDLTALDANLERSDAVVIGPGTGRGEAQKRFLSYVLAANQDTRKPLVIDADSLTSLGALGGLTYLASCKGTFVLTPHVGELSRLLGVDPSDIGRNRRYFARKAAEEANAVVCLKGAGTCVANVSGEDVIITSGSPAMATAGSGDVLTGVIAALAAQGLSAFQATWVGAYWHGLSGELAAKRAGSYGILAGEISDALPEARALIAGR